MHRLFHPLDRRRAALLLTLMTHGGQAELHLLDLLNDERSGDIREKAATLLQIPGEKRALFIARELKELLSEFTGRGIEHVDPSWLVQALAGENPRVIAAVLIGLPNHLIKAVVERLPDADRRRLPRKDDAKGVPMPVVQAIRMRFEERFAPMPLQLGAARHFGFRDIIWLESRELALLMRSLGLEELAQAFVSVGRYALAELCKRLPRQYAAELIEAVKQTSSQDAMELKSAQRFLGRVLIDFEDTEELSRKAGLYRLSKALAVEDAAYLQAFYQRLPKTLGGLLENYIAKVQEMSEIDAERAQRLQDATLRRVQQMSKRGEISTRYGDFNFQFHQEPAAELSAQPA